MEQFLLIIPIDVDKYKIKINKKEHWVPIEIIYNLLQGYILPICALENEELIKKLKPKQLETLEIVNKEDITFINYL